MPTAHGIMHILDSVSGKSRPLTLASNVLAVDGSASTQPISAASLPLPTGAATQVAQSDIESAVNSVNTSLASTLIVDGSASTQPVSAASLPLPTGAATQVFQSAIESAVNNVNTTLGGTLTVTTAVAKSATTVSSAASVAASDLSGAHDARQHRRLAIFGTTTDTSNNIDIHVSADGITYYKLGYNSIFPDSDQSFSLLLDAPFGYIKLKYNGTATVTAIISGSN